MLKLCILVLYLISFSIKANSTFEFKSNLSFIKNTTIIEGQMESYSLKNNDQVKLLISFLEDKSFKSEIDKMKPEQIANKMLEKNLLLDFINQYSQRKILNLKMETKSNFTSFKIQYEILDKNIPSIEDNIYIVNETSTAIASIVYPKNISESLKLELQSDLEQFNIISEPGDFTVFEKVKKNLKNLRYVFNLAIDSAYANELSTKYSACNAKEYIGKGAYNTKPGSSLFNLSKIAEDIKQEAVNQTLIKENKGIINDSRLNCLGKLYKDAKEGAANFWANKLNNEGCIEGDTIADKGNSSCKDSSLKEFKNSKNYLEKVDADLTDFLNGKVEIERSSCKIPDNAQRELDEFKKLGATATNAFCCANGDEGNFFDKGPLVKALEDDENFKKLDPQQKTIQCLQKTKEDPSKSFMSINGISDCMESMYEGMVKLLKDALKTVASLFELETYKALGKFISNMPDSGKELLNTLGDHITTELYSVTTCMSSYEAKMYTCKMVPSVAATLLGPGLIKNFAKAIVDKTSKTAIGEMVAKAMAENKSLQKVKAASNAAIMSTKKIVAPVLESKMIKPSVMILQKVTKILGKDVSSPIKDRVLTKVKSLKQMVTGIEAVEGSVLKRDIASNMAKEIDQFQTLKSGEKTAENLEKAQELKAQLLKNATNLSNEDRLKLAEIFTRDGAPLNETQKSLILEAHEVGLSEGRGFGTYSQDDIIKKTRLLKEAGITDHNERRLLMESGITGAEAKSVKELMIPHKDRLLAEKNLNTFTMTGNKEALKEGLKQSRTFYSQFLNDGKLAEQFFTPDQKGFAKLVMANERGLKVKESSKIYSQVFKGTADEIKGNLKNGINSLNNLISEYENMIKNGTKGVTESIQYKIYRARELRNELMDNYYTSKYRDKFNDIDFDRMHERETNLYKKYQEELEKSKKEMTKLKIPLDGDLGT